MREPQCEHHRLHYRCPRYSKILAYLDKAYPTSATTTRLPPLRAPPNEKHDFNIQRDFNFGA